MALLGYSPISLRVGIFSRSSCSIAYPPVTWGSCEELKGMKDMLCQSTIIGASIALWEAEKSKRMKCVRQKRLVWLRPRSPSSSSLYNRNNQKIRSGYVRYTRYIVSSWIGRTYRGLDAWELWDGKPSVWERVPNLSLEYDWSNLLDQMRSLGTGLRYDDYYDNNGHDE